MRAALLAGLLVCACFLVGGTAPGQQADPPPKVDFVAQVAPLLLARCIECHGPKEQRGDLRLDRRAALFGEEPEAWPVAPGRPDASELIRRVELPASDEEVMPNKGEPLRPEQIRVLRDWIAAGADWPAAGDEFFVAAEAAMAVPRIDFGIAAPDPEQQARIDAALRRLQDRGVVAQRIAADTMAVDVNASLLGNRFTDEDLLLLQDLAPVLVWLNLQRTAVTDQGLAALRGFGVLRRLSVANTAVGDGGIEALGVLPKLEVLNAYGSRLGDAGLRVLAGLPALRKVYAFDSKVTAAGAAALAAARADLTVDRGEYVEARLQQAQQEIAERERQRAEEQAKQKAAEPVNETCPVADKPVDAATTLQHDGLTIAFCCAKCRATFAADPTKFATAIAAYKQKAAGGK